MTSYDEATLESLATGARCSVCRRELSTYEVTENQSQGGVTDPVSDTWFCDAHWEE